jgi:DNA-binding CsgD family transcriptional regulator
MTTTDAPTLTPNKEAWAALTPRQREVTQAIAVGFSTQEIASLLGITVATVHTYTKSCFAALKVHSKSELVAKVYDLHEQRAVRLLFEGSDLRNVRLPGEGGGVRLAPHERRVATLLAYGAAPADVAIHCGLTVQTVHTYEKRLHVKLRVFTRNALIAKLFDLRIDDMRSATGAP